ncbi:unnamed protein product [Cylindrotheca closterium]|uniref:FHA domain-containing protein n=1 Tax=Cylindrotheca closterium TaxID=2856 RepID=A0AAD2G6G8_9STRA|nr:unnamed protein product [Cylindrotheca closterium]
MSTKQVTDDEALRALLSSAAERDEERKIERKGNERKRWESRNDDRQQGRGSNKRSRYDDRSGRGGNQQNNNSNENSDYYGPASEQGRRDDDGSSGKNNKDNEKPPPTHKPNFGLSGALAKDEGGGGNVYKGVVLKFREPPEARAPNTQWRFYLFKGKDLVDTLHISKQSAYLMGRNTEIADIPMAHPSLSSQHAVLQYRALPTKDGSRLSCQPYIMDLESTNGTFLNGVRIDSARYYQLKKGDVLKFGASTREYVLMTENTTLAK